MNCFPLTQRHEIIPTVGQAVSKKIKELPVNDFFAKNGKVREDGRMVHDLYVFAVKKPEESREPWDYLKLVRTIPGDQAFRPLAEGERLLAKAAIDGGGAARRLLRPVLTPRREGSEHLSGPMKGTVT